MTLHPLSFTIIQKREQNTMQYLFWKDLPDIWKQMHIRVITIFRVLSVAPARHTFEDILSMLYQKEKTMITTQSGSQGAQFCSKLFEYEDRSKALKHTAEQRKAYRLEKELPILEAFWSWLDKQKPYKGSRFQTAVNYAQNQEETSMTYLEDGHCSLSNNLSENSIRPFTVGRKNWLFSDTGAEASSFTYTMVEMAKANDLNVYKYLEFLLTHRPSETMTDEQLEDLAPWSEKAKSSCQL